MLDNSYENMSNVACFFIERIKNNHTAGGLHGCRKRKNLLVLDDQDQYFSSACKNLPAPV